MTQLFELILKSIINQESKNQSYQLCSNFQKKTLEPIEQIKNSIKILRTDINIKNNRNKKISGILFTSNDYQTQQVLVYLHDKGGCKLQVLSFLNMMGKYKIAIAAFDFLGCGSSEQDYITYGINQIFDIKIFLDQLRALLYVQRFYLWGRGMGSLCSIMFAQSFNQYINGMILDTPFKKIDSTLQRISYQQSFLPKIIIKQILQYTKKKTVQKTSCSFFKIDYLQIFKRIKTHIPILFIYSSFDGIVPVQQIFEFYNTYQGQKDLCQILNTHQQQRSQEVYQQGLKWITKSRKKYLNGILQAKYLKYQQRQKFKLNNNNNKSQTWQLKQKQSENSITSFISYQNIEKCNPLLCFSKNSQ